MSTPWESVEVRFAILPPEETGHHDPSISWEDLLAPLPDGWEFEDMTFVDVTFKVEGEPPTKRDGERVLKLLRDLGLTEMRGTSPARKSARRAR